jgi:hypothetical protein
MTSVAEPQVHSRDLVPSNLPLDAAALHQASFARAVRGGDVKSRQRQNQRPTFLGLV